MPKQFKLTKTDDSELVMGPIGEDNVYIVAYGAPVNKDDKEPKDLEVGESVLRRYSLSGQVGVYKVVRLEDQEEERVVVLCGCGWGSLALPLSQVPACCPMCGGKLERSE